MTRAAVSTTLEANVIESKGLAVRTAVALAATALIGVSAFAESRPSNETRGRRSEDGAIRRGRAAAPAEAGKRNETRNRATARAEAPRRSGSSIDVRGRSEQAPGRQRGQAIDRRQERAKEGTPRMQAGSTTRHEGARRERETTRERVDRNRDRRTSRDTVDADRNRDRRSSRVDADRDRRTTRTHRDGRVDRNDRSRNQRDRDRVTTHHRDSRRYEGRSYTTHRNGRQRYFTYGRVSQVHRYGSGYRIWVHGAPYPFFIPAAHYHRDRFRIGLMIHLGGYYNPSGYYDYYDVRSRGELYGVVESVDYYRNSFVVRNDATGSFVTVLARRHEIDQIRPGDFVELYGNWRRGLFEARDVELIDTYRAY